MAHETSNGDESDTDRSPRLEAAVLAAGPIAGLIAFFLVPSAYVGTGGEVVTLGAAGRGAAGVAAWMAVWWLTEALHISVTALLPLALFPLAEVRTIGQTASSYANDVIFLFMGGFLLSLSMERWNLHRRIALTVLRWFGTRPNSVVGGFMLITAVLSMWVSNTATAVMMVPIAVSILGLVDEGEGGEETSGRLGVGLLLGIAYSASIGGVGTLIGTPPNVFLASYVSEQLGHDLSFARWMSVGIPFVAVFLPLTWWLLTRVLFDFERKPLRGGDAFVRDELEALGPMNRGETITLVVFVGAALAWVFRRPLADVTVGGIAPFAHLTDPGIAMLAAMVLFVAPAGNGERVLTWEKARELPWGILILFGGGLSLAAAIDETGVGRYLGSQIAFLEGIPTLAVLLTVTATVVVLTELTSNTATTATFLPILAGVAPGLGIEPMLLLVPAAMAASCAFMLPVATPPNAIVFGSDRLSMQEMRRAGIWLNLTGILLITGFAYTFVAVLLVG